jgi:transaldolase
VKLYLNSCEPEEIREIADWGVLAGVTMNPSMVATLNRDYVKNLRAICSIVEGDVYAQVVSERAEDIVEEARALSAIHQNVIVKVHTNSNGMKAIHKLHEHGIRTCATGVHSVVEAIVAERAGADHVALFIGLLEEADEHETSDLVSQVRTAFDHAQARTQIMAAVRTIKQFKTTACAGADEITAPYKTWKLLFQNPHTLARWNSFIGDWRKAYGERSWRTGYEAMTSNGQKA